MQIMILTFFKSRYHSLETLTAVVATRLNVSLKSSSLANPVFSYEMLEEYKMYTVI